tara:strand:+ start:1312 stop:2241 length:930 start_codon:yes stop_codon:yes gene_type:complete
MAEAEKQIELDVEEEQDTEVEIPAPVAEVSSDKPQIEVSQETEQQGEQHEEYSASVKKRIDKLTKKMREAERQRDEAIGYAKNVQTESDKLKNRMQSLDQGYMQEYGNRLEMQEEQVKAELERAVDQGDSKATVEAQQKLTEIGIAANQYKTAKKQQEQRLQQEQAARDYYAANPQEIPQQMPQQPAPEPDPKAQDWATKNEWFGQDEAMTFAAFGIHKRLVESEGFDPTSDEYYDELDRTIREEFPNKFSDGSSPKRPAQNVAGVSRSTGSTRTGRSGNKKVRLTPSQVAIAKKLGVPLEEYAKYVKE